MDTGLLTPLFKCNGGCDFDDRLVVVILIAGDEVAVPKSDRIKRAWELRSACYIMNCETKSKKVR